jgi:hypothetical protein
MAGSKFVGVEVYNVCGDDQWDVIELIAHASHRTMTLASILTKTLLTAHLRRLVLSGTIRIQTLELRAISEPCSAHLSCIVHEERGG